MGFLVARGNPQPPDLKDSPDDINLQNNINKINATGIQKIFIYKVAFYAHLGHILVIWILRINIVHNILLQNYVPK